MFFYPMVAPKAPKLKQIWSFKHIVMMEQTKDCFLIYLEKPKSVQKSSFHETTFENQ
jgi:hypothetical protein